MCPRVHWQWCHKTHGGLPDAPKNETVNLGWQVHAGRRQRITALCAGEVNRRVRFLCSLQNSLACGPGGHRQ